MATHRMFVCLWVTKLRKTCTNRNRDWHWRFWRESQRSAGQASPHSQAARGVGSLHKAQSQATLPEGRLLNLVGGTRLKAHKLKQSGRDGSLTQLSTRGYQTLQAIRMNSLLKQPRSGLFPQFGTAAAPNFLKPSKRTAYSGLCPRGSSSAGSTAHQNHAGTKAN